MLGRCVVDCIWLDMINIILHPCSRYIRVQIVGSYKDLPCAVKSWDSINIITGVFM